MMPDATRLTWSLALAVFLFLTAMPSIAGAQVASAEKRYTDPMTIEIEGDFDFDAILDDKSLDDSEVKRYSLAFAPAVGLFVVKGLQLGLAPAVQFDMIEDGGDKISSVLGGAYIFLRYVLDLRSIVYPFFGVRMGALGGEDKIESGGAEHSTDSTVLNAGPEVGLKIEVSHAIFTFYFRYLFNGIKYEDIDNWDHKHAIRLGVGFGLWI
jgi:hypothetical protein